MRPQAPTPAPAPRGLLAGTFAAGLLNARATLGGALSRIGKAGGSGKDRGDVDARAAATAAVAAAAAVATVCPLPVAAPGSLAVQAVPATAVTALLLTDDSRMLLAGCADGRLCIVTDPALAQRTLAMQLQQGLFGLGL